MNSLFVNAIKEAAKVRNHYGLNLFEPMNIYDFCYHAGVLVRMVDINMEGIYVRASSGKKPTILLSNERPLPRRAFTCAHEFGHHYFGHGSKIDALDYTKKYTAEQNQEELLVNTFAGSLLMPMGGVQSQFNKRRIDPKLADPVHFYLISSYFGVGFQTLVHHCRANKIIPMTKAKELLRYSPARILKESCSDAIETSHYKYIDDVAQPPIVELEVGNYLILPKAAVVDAGFLEVLLETELGVLHGALRPGISEVKSSNFTKNIKVRIEPKKFAGLSHYRHLE